LKKLGLKGGVAANDEHSKARANSTNIHPATQLLMERLSKNIDGAILDGQELQAPVKCFEKRKLSE